MARLVASGHNVTAVTRSAEAASALDAAGCRGIVCDVFDEEALDRAVDAASPDVIVHQLTALPEALDPRRKGVYDATNRLRSEGTRLLVEAGRRAGARRIVAQSIAFLYAPEGDEVKDESAGVMTDVEGEFAGALMALADLEAQVLGAEGMDGLVLRYGFFYGPGTAYASDGYWANEVRKRRFPIVGSGDGIFSFIHTEDAAAATVAAVERGRAGIYNVVDDDPAPLREWLPAYAEAVEARRPFRVPAWLARLAAGKQMVAMATSLRGASNAKARAELGWEPLLPSWREGFREALDRAPPVRR